MINILTVLCAAFVIWVVENIRPNVVLKKTDHWYIRAFSLNGLQAIIAAFSTYLWDVWFQNIPLYSIVALPQGVQVLIGYVTITFFYYWWHRLRHSTPFLWKALHQLHHSPTRIEVITSFYKHPLEIVVNGILSSAILYILLGLSVTSVGLCVLVTALAELFYHMNIKTPWVIGLFLQRPEMHRVHHQRGLHYHNFSDLPVWDMLFGTYLNPKVSNITTGFPDGNENKLWELLKGEELKS